MILLLSTFNVFPISNFLDLDPLLSTKVEVTFPITSDAEIISSHQMLEQSLVLDQTLVLNFTRQLSVLSRFSPDQQTAHPTVRAINDLLLFQQSAFSSIWLEAKSELDLVDSLDFTRGGHNQLSLTDSAIFNIVKNLIVSHTLTLISLSNTYFTDYKCDFVAVPIPPKGHSQVIFAYQTLAIVLPRPDLGDSDSLEHTRVNRRNRGNELQLFRESYWPKTEILKMKFSNMTVQEKDSLVAFMKVTTALPVQMTDYDGNLWNGIVIEPVQIQEELRECGFAAEVQFQGVLT